MTRVEFGGGNRPEGFKTPDFNRTPTPGTAVPTPFPNVASSPSPDAGNPPAKIKSKEAFLKESSRALAGSEAGTLTGVISNVIKGSPSFAALGLKVKAEGKDMTTLSHPLQHLDQKTDPAQLPPDQPPPPAIQ